MRPLGISMEGVNGSTGLVNNTRSHSTTAELVYEWNVWETQAMVFLSFMLQLFLLLAGRVRRRKTNVVLKALIWLAYVGADFVAVYALGLFSQYEDRYKLGRESSGDTLPFLWVPFLIVHLGGQDSITAFSIEDNNLWLRHLLNLATQGVLALYVFWKSFHRINYSILIPAMLVFVSGIIKYGERVWALKSASRNSLAESFKLHPNLHYNRNGEPSNESFSLQIVLLARGLFVGRTLLQLAHCSIPDIFVRGFQSYVRGEDKLKVVMMELGMMFDLLYTKANVLQRWTGVLFRCASQALMVSAFLLFLITEKQGSHNHNRVNVVITYTLFAGAMFMEACSVAVAMASPWSRAHFKEGTFLHGLSNIARSFFKVIQWNKGHRTNMSLTSMGQYNFVDYCIGMKYKPGIMLKAICAIGLDSQWRNLWYVHNIYDTGKAGDGIIDGVMKILGRTEKERFPQRCFGRSLSVVLGLPFEHALYRLHVYTDLHIMKYFADTNTGVIFKLKEECETLSNYMMYLMVVHPSMLPVSAVAEDFEPELLKLVSNSINARKGAWTKKDFLDEYTKSGLQKMPHHSSSSPFELEPEDAEQRQQSFEELKEALQGQQSLEEIKEMWLRLLMYAAGKCPGELHARQLGEGGELISFVWLLMVHHDLGDVAQELKLYTSNDPNVPVPEYTVLDGKGQLGLRQEPPYAFRVSRHTRRDIRKQVMRPRRRQASTFSRASELDEAETSSMAGPDDNAATPSEIDDQVEKTAMQIESSQHAKH